MISIRINNNLNELSARLAGLSRQIPFATAVAINATVDKIVQAEQREMRDVFDRPTPYTLDSILTRRATKATLTAQVKLKDFGGKGTPASRFLAPQITGGLRSMKRFEIALQAVGAMPTGFRIVPGAGAKLDAYGNLDRGQIVQILSFFKAFPEMGYRANMTDKRRRSLARGSKTKQGYGYFAGRPGDRLPLGIYQRFGFGHGSAIKPVMIFVPSAVYRALYDFHYVGKITVEREFNQAFSTAFAAAIRTARP